MTGSTAARKRCRLCNETKQQDQFRHDPRMRDGLYSYCKPCESAKARQWQRANPERRALIEARRKPRSYEQRREATLRREYGITLAQYEALRISQDGRCAICGVGDPGRPGGTFAVDHDHLTGQVRGLLCHSCNLALGHFDDNTDRLRAAITYLGG